MPFYDLHTYTNQNIGENSLEEMISFAKKLGLSGLGVVRFHTEDIKPLPKDKDIDIVNVVMLKSDNPNELLEIAKK
ncbi:hypothetical protein HZA99_03375 [Candidatus Woesearchaeota archaeon]|nr:hypothetical protein [Candidatus Woesearchaeota archaeon]